MRFMNEYEIDRVVITYATHPVLGPATRTLASLADWADRHSDGWAYWPKPARAAAKLMELIERDGTGRYDGGPREDATPEQFRMALIPIKSFRTRWDADFHIEEMDK